MHLHNKNAGITGDKKTKTKRVNKVNNHSSMLRIGCPEPCKCFHGYSFSSFQPNDLTPYCV